MNKSKGSFVVSIDFELAWGGFFDEEIYINNLKYYKESRKAIDKILELFERYKISATWAFVGHLMLETCIKEKNTKHPDLVRPSYKWFEKDWFYLDPGSREEANSIWYADDVLKRVVSCKTKQEIASHSFSHILFGEEGCSKECAESDIKKCVEVALSNNIKLSSFIFPCHSEGHKDILKNYGFSIYRSHGIGWHSHIKNKKVKRLALIFDKVFALSPTTGRLEKDEYGLYYNPENMCYYRYKGWKNTLTYKSVVKQAKKGIDVAIEKGEVFHFWFHPYQVACNLVDSLDDLEEIFSYVNTKVDAELIENVTMKQLVENREK